jgi:hypothetical protein
VLLEIEILLKLNVNHRLGGGFSYYKISMNKKALLALSIAILIPVVSYMLLKMTSDRAIVMPRRYYADSILIPLMVKQQQILSGIKCLIYI